MITTETTIHKALNKFSKVASKAAPGTYLFIIQHEDEQRKPFYDVVAASNPSILFNYTDIKHHIMLTKFKHYVPNRNRK